MGEPSTPAETFTIERQLSDEQDNARQIKQAIGGLWDVAPKVVGLYERLGQVFEPCEQGHDGAARALLFAYRSSVMALMHVVRMQFVEAAMHRRQALEWVALAGHLWEVPADFDLWVRVYEHGLDPRAHPRWKEHWAKFNPNKINDYLEALSPQVHAAHGDANPFVHSTLLGQARATSVADTADPDAVALNVRFIDFEGPDVAPIAAEIFGLLNEIFLACDGFAERALTPNRVLVWRGIAEPLRVAVAREAVRWKSREN